MVKVRLFTLIMASFIVQTACSEIIDLFDTKELVSLTVTQPPAKTAYSVNETFSSTGLVVTAFYLDGSSGVITGYSLSKPDMAYAGIKPITVSFQKKSTRFDITVAAFPETLTIFREPEKTIYSVGELFDPTGLKVTASYADGSSGDITDYTISKPDMNSAGTKTITVTFKNMTASFTIQVAAQGVTVTLSSIAVTNPPAKTAYYVNESFNRTGLVVTASYSNGSSGAVTGYSLSTPTMSSTGTKTITVTFQGKTASFNITVAEAPPGVTLSSITVSKNPAKTIYYVDDVFDPAELEVKAHYSNGSSVVITGYSLSTPPPDMSSAGTKTITVTFQGKTASFNIVVNAVTLSSITVTTPPAKTAYNVGDTFTPAGLVVTAVYANGSSAAITTGYTLSTPTMNTEGTKTITVTFQGKTASFNIVVTAVKNDTGDIGIIVY